MKKYYLTVWLLLIFSMLNAQQNRLSTIRTNANRQKIIVYTTAQKTQLKLTPTDTILFYSGKQPLETEITVIVNPLKSFQKFIGMGGAITDASAEVFAKLSSDKQQELLDAYYDDAKGIGYRLARTNIHSCDFSSDSYTYVADSDPELKTFSVKHDLKFRLPLIKRAIHAAGGDLLIFASPWSPPAFMKDNNDMLHGGKLLTKYDQAWANYFVKFIKAYSKDGVKIWGITIQNEPLASQKWESCLFTAEEERDFLKFYLGPTLAKNGLADEKVIVWDHNRDIINEYADVILNDPDAAKYVWGIGFHWYETWTGGQPMFSNVGELHEAYPKKHILFTEGCVERFDATKFNYWPNAERYGASIINDFNNGATGWTDWNILLDENGGPNHAQNFVFAPIHANTITGELIYTPVYFYLGQFSKFIRPGAKRISTASTRSSLLCTSFLNANGKIATVIMNQSNEAIDYNLYLLSKMAACKIPPHAIQTLVY